MKNIYIDKYTTTFVYLDCYHYFTSDAHPVVRPETLLFPNETYIFFLSVTKKSVISFSSRQITFWIVIIISPLINYPLSVFFLSTLIRFPVECSEYYPTSTYFMELPPTNDFISTESGQREISLLRSRELSCWCESENFSWENYPLIFTPYHHNQVWRVYIPTRHFTI